MISNNESAVEKYIEILKTLGALSRLFSDSKVPYLYYRVAENAFCLAFGAENLSRGDVSVDAKIGSTGIGLKTFTYSKNGSMEKVAEFNKARSNYVSLMDNPEKLVKHIAELRNKRIQFTKDAYSLDKTIYHCVIRDAGTFYIAEEPLEKINVEKIKNVKNDKDVSIAFEDDKNEYSFNLSKSTLFKRFRNNYNLKFDVKIFDNPFDLIDKLYVEKQNLLASDGERSYMSVILPLYSERGERHVPERSGLNQWNANGRTRNNREVYIPIPAWIHQEYPTFFPSQDEPFNLILPNGDTMSVRVCQGGRKALMSNPNKKLGEWLIDKVLKIEDGKMVTIEQLDDIGIDSVEVKKIDSKNFQIDFKETGSYDSFKEQYAPKV